MTCENGTVRASASTKH